MPTPESVFSFFGKGKKDKDKTPPAGAELASAGAKETPDVIDREMLFSTAIGNFNRLLSEAEKHKNSSKGMVMLEKASTLLGLVEKAKDDPSAMPALNEYVFSASSRDIRATTPEGKEVSMDLATVLAESKDTYQSFNLKEFSEALPETVSLSETALNRCKEALEQGFDRAVFFPDLETQDKAGITKLKQELADKPLPKGALKDEKDNYPNESYLENPIAEKHFLTDSAKAKRANGYLLFYSSEAVPQETKNLKYSEAEQWLKDRNQDGLTLPEYYILQRKEALDNKDHSFDDYDNEGEKSNWTWLIDSRAPGGWFGASWDPGGRQVRVVWRDADCRGPELGARPAIVVPIL